MKKTAASLLASGAVDELLAMHRAVFGAARMEDDPEAAARAAAEAKAAADKAAAEAADKKFSQTDMNATVARAEAAAKAKAEADLATALGCTVEEAKQIIADRKAADDAKKTEAEKAAAAAAKAQADAEAIKAEATTERHHARLERALSKAGLDVDNAALLRAGLAAIDVPVDADADAVKAAVDKLKTDAPALFGAPAGSGGTHTDPGNPRRTTDAPAGEFGAKGKEEAKRRWGDQKTA